MMSDLSLTGTDQFAASLYRETAIMDLKRLDKSAQDDAFGLNDPKVRQNFFISYCLGCLLGFSLLWFTHLSPGFPLGGPSDFTAFYTGAQVVRSGQIQNLYNPETQMEVQSSLLRPNGWLFSDGLLPFVYPPFFVLIFLPLTCFPLAVAFHAWNLVSLMLLLASILLLLKSWNYLSMRNFFLSGLVVLAFFPTFETLNKGQSTFLLIFITTLCYLQLVKRNDLLAGIALGFTLMKPQLALVLFTWILVQRRWRAALSFLCVAVILATLSYEMIGAEGIRQYISMLGMMWEGPFTFYPEIMPNIRGTIYRFAATVEWLGGPAVSTQMIRWTSAVLSLAGLTAFLYSFRSRRWSRDAFSIQFAAVVTMTLLLTPYLYNHDLSLMILAGLIVFLVFVARGRPLKGKRVIALGHISLLVPLMFTYNALSAQIVVLILLVIISYLHALSRQASH